MPPRLDTAAVVVMTAERDQRTGRWWDRRCIHDDSLRCRSGAHVWRNRLPHPPTKRNRTSRGWR